MQELAVDSNHSFTDIEKKRSWEDCTFSRPMRWKHWHEQDEEWWHQLQEHYEVHFPTTKETRRIIIPRRIHQIWLGPIFNLPLTYQKWMNIWKERHPDWEYKLWTDENIVEFVSTMRNKDAFKAATNYGAQSDILRYELLFQFGGLYVDVDFECIQSFDTLHEQGFAFYTGVSNTGTVELNNGLIASVPAHRMLMQLMQTISGQVTAAKKSDEMTTLMTSFMHSKERAMLKNMWRQEQVEKTIEGTGPGLFTRTFMSTLMRSKQESKDMMAFPNLYFYSLPNDIKLQADGACRSTTMMSMAVHHWGKSWMNF